jgi:hypothetical protein
MHGSRPYLIHFPAPQSYSSVTIQPILDSWRFADEEGDTAPSPSTDETYTDPTGVYRVRVPEGWRPSPHYLPDAVVFFLGGANGAAIFVGTPDGTITLCQFGPCQTVTARTLEELRTAVQVTSPSGYGPESAPYPGALERAALAVIRPIELGGEPGEKKSANTSPGWLLGPEMYDWVYALHDGRPVAIRFDHWPRGGEARAGRTELVESFEFLDSDPDSAGETETFVFSDAGFAVDVPAGWVASSPAASSGVQIGGAEGSLRVRTSEGGRLESCGHPCVRLPSATLEDVIAILVAEYQRTWVAVDSPGVETTPINLDGVDATFVRIGPPDTFAGRNGPGAGSETEVSAVFFRDGRAVVISWIPGTGVAGYLGDLLDTVRFDD